MTNIQSVLQKQAVFHRFAGANTRYGFIGLYDSIFRAGEFESIYVIHGAPGTGKSHLMKTVAARIPEASQERLYCSSDPDSLDGLILSHSGRKIGLLDGTAPHSRSISLPGTVETVLDLGAFWNRHKLKNERGEITSQVKYKKTAYENAYAALGLAGHIESEKMRILHSAFLKEKAEKFAQRLMRRIGAPIGEQRIRYLSALGMFGVASRREDLSICQRVWRVPPYYGFEKLLLDTVARYARESGVEHVRFPDVLDPYYTECLLFPKSECAVLVGDRDVTEEDFIITPTRFVDCPSLRRERSSLRTLAHMLTEEKNTALRELSLAGKAHFALEKIFAKAMDFAAKEEFAEKTVETIRNELFLSQ